MRQIRFLAALALVAGPALSSPPRLRSTAGAAPSKTFRQTTAKDFEEGEATASMILPDGTVVPGMKRSPVSVDAAFVWCSGLAPTERPPTSGPATRGASMPPSVTGGESRARKVVQLDAAWVTALVARPDGTLVAGTTPGGKLYTVDPKKGEARQFATLGTDHVWTLVLDAKSGVVYAGTGARGRSSPSIGTGAAKSSGTRATSTSCRCCRPTTAPLRGDQRGGDPLPGRASTGTPRRWGTSTPRRCARWPARATRSTSQ